VARAALQKGVEPYPHCRLVQFLGRGGWGEVWKAEHDDGSAEALKFLPCDSPLAVAQEIRALQFIRQLKHPHLIRINSIWAFSGHVVIAMELAEGSLQDLFEVYQCEHGTGILPQHLCAYLKQAALALDFLNARQHTFNGQKVAVRHCDVKPSNLLVLDDRVKLADFSLSAQTTSPMGYHRKVGTLNYTAPELWRGVLSDRADQYSLAVTYHELRTGRLPFPPAPLKFVKDYVRPEPDLSLLAPEEQSIIARALSPVPQDRWPSCVEMMERLGRQVKEMSLPSPLST
jgi:serine/threonine protein kinase